jgi:predicted enzyme related to lactoylglutathione lyase
MPVGGSSSHAAPATYTATRRNRPWGTVNGALNRKSTSSGFRADQPYTPAHWIVTFAVDDADAAAAKATELGGKVIVPLFDAPFVRMAAIGDPQAATFIASKFVPENKDLGSQADAATGSGYLRLTRSESAPTSDTPS